MSLLTSRIVTLGLLGLMVGCTPTSTPQASPSPSSPPISITAPINKAKSAAADAEKIGKQHEQINPETPQESPSP